MEKGLTLDDVQRQQELSAERITTMRMEQLNLNLKLGKS